MAELVSGLVLPVVEPLGVELAASVAAVLERLASAPAMERRLLGLDQWQHQMSTAAMNAEIATILGISEAATNGLVEHSAVMVRELPATHRRVGSRELGWVHAVIIAEETMLLRNNGLPDTPGFEKLLLDHGLVNISV